MKRCPPRLYTTVGYRAGPKLPSEFPAWTSERVSAGSGHSTQDGMPNPPQGSLLVDVKLLGIEP
jgi:hypothetical protein